MKYSLIKSKVFFAISCLLIMVTSCVKEREGFTDLTQTSDLVILNGAGTANFKASNVLVNVSSPDTVKKTVLAVLASNNSNNGSVTVTLGVDNAAIAAYNSANGTNFQAFPANAFKLVSSTITIPGGLEHTGATTLWIFQNKLDPAISYLLPIAITDGGGKGLSSNQNIIYYNVIGNPLAGNYVTVGTRYNYTGSIGYSCGSPIPGGAGLATSPSPKLASPVDSKVIAIDYANLGGSGYQYLISIDPTNPNNAIVTSNSALAAALPLVIYCVHTYNPATKQFHILSWYNNGAGGSGGSDRIIDEVFTKQ